MDKYTGDEYSQAKPTWISRKVLALSTNSTIPDFSPVGTQLKKRIINFLNMYIATYLLTYLVFQVGSPELSDSL